MNTDERRWGGAERAGTALLLQSWASPVLSPNIARDQCNIRPLGFDANDLRRSCSGLTLSEMRKHRVETSASVRSLAEVLILQAVRCSWNKQVSCQSSSSRVLRTLARHPPRVLPLWGSGGPRKRRRAAWPHRERNAPGRSCCAYGRPGSPGHAEAEQLRLPAPICVHLRASAAKYPSFPVAALGQRPFDHAHGPERAKRVEGLQPSALSPQPSAFSLQSVACRP
jgi:hypothetical protein